MTAWAQRAIIEAVKSDGEVPATSNLEMVDDFNLRVAELRQLGWISLRSRTSPRPRRGRWIYGWALRRRRSQSEIKVQFI